MGDEQRRAGLAELSESVAEAEAIANELEQRNPFCVNAKTTFPPTKVSSKEENRLKH